MSFDTLVHGGTVVLEDGLREVDVAIAGGRVAALLPRPHSETAREHVDARGLHVFPGVIDPHTHFGLGGDDDWRSESRSAALGGVTTVINYVMGPASYFEQVPVERERADRLSCVDYALHVVPCAQGHLNELHRTRDELGVASFKFFMSFKGSEGAYLGVEGTDDGFLYEYLRLVGEREGLVANVHPENIEVVWKLREEVKASGLTGLAAWDASRPDFVEAEATARAAFYAELLGAPLYIVHVSSRLCLDEIRAARARPARRAPLWAETCPHYLTHTVDAACGTRAKVNPPVRHADDVEALWAGLAAGEIETVGSDHVPRHFSFKDREIWSASAGFPGAASILTVLLSEGHHKRGLPLERIAAVTSAGAARIFGLKGKGTLLPGADADLVLVDLAAERTVAGDAWQSAAGYSIYDGFKLKGWPLLTMRRGETIARMGAGAAPGGGAAAGGGATPGADGGEVLAAPGSGRYIAR